MGDQPGSQISGKISSSLWQRARDAYYNDTYDFKNFESLHVLNILHYERELCLASANLVSDGTVNGAPGAQNQPLNADNSLSETDVEKLRRLLRGHAQAIADLESILRREATYPDTHYSRKDEAHIVPPDRAGRCEYAVEHHVYSIKPGLALDLVHKLVHRLIPARLKYHFFVRAQMRERRAHDADADDAQRRRRRGDHDAAGAVELGARPPPAVSGGPSSSSTGSSSRGGLHQHHHRELAGQRNRRRYAPSPRVDRVARVLVAFLGGAALLVPMLVMTPRGSAGADRRLVTVCVAVLVFSLLMGAGTKATHQEVLAASAAYAAVLVVYVGSATSGQN